MLDFCADILSEKRYERVVRKILSLNRGQWSSLKSIFSELKMVDIGMLGDEFCVWLDPPERSPGFVLLLFYDTSTGESLTAEYNKARLVDGG